MDIKPILALLPLLIKMARETIYRSKKRYYNPDYPYRIEVEKDDKQIIISNYSIKNPVGVTHGIGITIRDLERIIKKLKK